MNLDEIKELITLMRKNRISEIDLEQKGTKVRIIAEPSSRTQTAPVVTMPPMHPTYYVPTGAPAIAPESAPLPSVGPSPVAEQKVERAELQEAIPSNLVEIKSPMVGTFYRAPSPDSPPYVDLGSVINKDTVLCIIEAMKLMNEIKAETQGRVVKVLVENGQPVEYNQPLFLVEPV